MIRKSGSRFSDEIIFKKESHDQKHCIFLKKVMCR